MQERWTIYCHIHIDSGRRYIGLTKKTVKQRWNDHCYAAKKSKNGRWHFPNAIRRYGKEAFSHEVLEVCHSLEVANLAEECWIEFYETRDPEKGFNTAKGGAHTPHPVRNPWDRPEYREKSCAAAKARWEDPVYRAKSQVAHAKKRQSLEFRQALSESTEKLWQDPDYRARMSASSREVNSRPDVKAKIISSRTGKPRSPEICAKISAARLGQIHPEERKVRIREASLELWQDPDYRARVLSNNKSSDPDVRAKISAAGFARQAAIRAGRSTTHYVCKHHGPILFADCNVTKAGSNVRYVCKLCRADYDARRKAKVAQHT